jgi:hypothetical protein
MVSVADYGRGFSSMLAAGVTAMIPVADATPPPVRAAPMPAFNPAALRLAIFLADAETSYVALAMDRFNAEMSAPRVTVSALMPLPAASTHSSKNPPASRESKTLHSLHFVARVLS